MHIERAQTDKARVAPLVALAPSFLVSLGTTEAFFHFHSFSLEFLAFGALWGGLYGLQSLLVNALRRQ